MSSRAATRRVDHAIYLISVRPARPRASPVNGEPSRAQWTAPFPPQSRSPAMLGGVAGRRLRHLALRAIILSGKGDHMRAIRTKVARIERTRRAESDADRRQHWLLSHRICACLVAHQPGMDRVRPEHTDPETFRDIQETLAWARGDYEEAERLADLNPDKHVPPPPGTPWAERMRLAREALDQTFEIATDRTERVRAAVKVANEGVPASGTRVRSRSDWPAAS